MLEAGVPFSVVATVMGWSASTAIRMAKRYGHMSQESQQKAVAAIDKKATKEAKKQTVKAKKAAA